MQALSYTCVSILQKIRQKYSVCKMESCFKNVVKQETNPSYYCH